MFKCLDVLLKLNHSLLEPDLDVIWAMLWKAECNAGVACNCLMTSLISTYVKLRQVHTVLYPSHFFLKKGAVTCTCLLNVVTIHVIFIYLVVENIFEFSLTSFSGSIMR